MIRFCLEQWDKNKEKLEQAIRADINLNTCDYKYLVQLVVRHILNEDIIDYYNYSENVLMIDDGGYQGTLIFVIHQNIYQPYEGNYLMTYVEYGSCSGCDTLLSIQNWDSSVPTETQVKDFMTLCKDLVCNMVCPWEHEGKFETVEFK